jgi:PIN domain nuclease of toxin-antitoxin system
VKFLLDTHVFLWLRLEPERVNRETRNRLATIDARMVLSAVSGWEMASKQALGRLALPDDARRWLPLALDELRCDSLALSLDHALEAAQLPLYHRDPFDRFIIAQARVEGLTVVTKDRHFARYDVEILRA